jgi:hypothetical protein
MSGRPGAYLREQRALDIASAGTGGWSVDLDIVARYRSMPSAMSARTGAAIHQDVHIITLFSMHT